VLLAERGAPLLALGRAQLLAVAWCASGWPARPAAPLPGGLGTGRPAAGQPVLQGPARKFSPLKIVENFRK